MADCQSPELSVVLPVYNEAKAIAHVIQSWSRALDRLGMRYEIRAYDDGSTDGTLPVLSQLAAQHPALIVQSHANCGHGPTILRGYREAQGEWVFQTDSDDEMPAAAFAELWQHRAAYDFLLGCRQRRQAPLPRRVITVVSRLAVRFLFERGCWDVNAPYRLMRGNWVREVVAQLPDDTVAPNVIMSGLAVRHGLRMYQCWVPHQPGRPGRWKGWKLWKAACRAFVQTVKASRSI